MDPSTALGSIAGNVVAAILAAAILGGIAWATGPLRWLIQRRELKRLVLGGRRFQFVFNPMTGASKVLTFLPNGTIGEGHNSNESKWRIRRGKLEILAGDGQVYSRFRRDADTGHLKHTNDPELRSIHGQYIQPLLIKVK